MKNIGSIILAVIAVWLVWWFVKWIIAVAMLLLFKVVMIAAFFGLVYVVYKALNKEKIAW